MLEIYLTHLGHDEARSMDFLSGVPAASIVSSGENRLSGFLVETVCSGRFRHIHIVTGWAELLSLLGVTESANSSMRLLREAGMKECEAAAFRGALPSELFPSLYYGKRFDILKKACLMAKRRFESMDCSTRIDCHLVASGIMQVVATSLCDSCIVPKTGRQR
ncbi:MAG: hypothetical protein HZA20_00320 [Nitrospirae bacterium]|nr:hypothetical protein [Nitrospirota bacterium]